MVVIVCATTSAARPCATTRSAFDTVGGISRQDANSWRTDPSGASQSDSSG